MSQDPHWTIKGMSPQLLVADLEASIAFYTRVLGFEVRFRYEDFYAGISKDGHSIHLKQIEPDTGERKRGKTNEDLDITFALEDIGRLYDQLQGAPIQFIQSLRDMPYGREFYVSDPDGHILAFLEVKEV
jgi:catechol 2,3-dioxygenase-like lactoylglutathione lyase family enzyme